MRATFESVELSVTTKKNALPVCRPVAGKFRFGATFEKASFVEEEDAKVIFGESNTRRIHQGKNYSIRWDKKKMMYIVRLQIYPNPDSLLDAEWNFEDCVNFLKREMYGK